MSADFIMWLSSVSVVVLSATILWKKWKSFSPNPFRDNFVRPPGPIITDQKKRNQVLKQGFKMENVPKELDAIVVGSGMGGLVCAACLSRAGKRVLVLEQHDRAGGSTHTFEEKGFEFDVGLHYLGELDAGSMNHTLFDVMTDGQLVWDPLDQEFDTVVLRSKDKGCKMFTYKAGKGEYEKRLMEYFPKEKEAILQFTKLLHTSKQAIVGYTMLKSLPIWLTGLLIKLGIFSWIFGGYNSMVYTNAKEALDKLTTNEELKLVLSYAFGDYGTLPSQAPILMHGVLMNHFYDGAYYPRGGSSELAFQMIPGIERSGGAVMVRAPVSRILFDGNKACGVSVCRGGNEYKIHAPIVISSIGLFNTCQNLLPKEISLSIGFEKLYQDVNRGPACFQTLVGLKGSTGELGLKKRNYWMFTDTDPERSIREYLALPRDVAANSNMPLVFASFPSAKDSSWRQRYSGCKSVCVIVTFLNWEWFEEWENERVMKRGPVYEDLKKAFQDQVWQSVLEIMPQLKDKVEYMDSGTPLSHKFYLGCAKGDIYGLDHNMRRFQYDLGLALRPKSKIPGLYMTGQDTFTCGVTGAAVSGMMTSAAILGRNHFIDLYRLMGERKMRQHLRKI